MGRQKYSELNTKNTAFFSTADTGYAIYAATSLLGIRRYLPDAQLFVLTSGLTGYEKKILQNSGIECLELDLNHKFTRTWDYPVEAFYMFAGPELFFERGFAYSVYLDGDVLCKRNPLQDLPEISGVAGVPSAANEGNNVAIFGEDWKTIVKTWNLPKVIERRRRVNSGVVYFNNQRMKDVGLLEKAADLFHKCLQLNIPRKGDDSLFSLLQYVYLKEADVQYLEPRFNFVLQFNDHWHYPINDLVFFHFSIDKPWKERPYSHDDPRLNIFNPYVREWRARFRQVAPWAWLRLIASKSTKISRVLKETRRIMRICYLAAAGVRKNPLTRKKNYMADPLRVYWWHDEENGFVNFGDELTREIVEEIFGYRSELTSIEECELIGVGSILEVATKRKNSNTIHVWGSGFIKPKESEFGADNLDNLVFHAVRGEKTRERIGKRVPLGDPGLLANVVYPRSKERFDKVGVVVHYIDANLPIVAELRKDPRFMVINPLDTPRNVALKITRCKQILSSSLHGLIFADSFGVPNMHIKLSDRLTGKDYKFEDYYSALGRKHVAADITRILDDAYLEEIRVNYKPIRNLRAIQRRLVKAFPNLR